MMKKIIALSCGRKNGNCETLVKEAAMGAEELGVATEIIRAMDLRVLPCKGCMACRKTDKCILDDDVDWILEKTLVEDCALIVAAPVYHLRSNAYLMAITERLNHFLSSKDRQITKKNRVGAFISVGGGRDEATPFGPASGNIFLQVTRVLVDQIQIAGAGPPFAMLLPHNKGQLARARQLGQNVAMAMSIPIEEVKYVGEEPSVSCPVCHCNLLQVFDGLPNVACPVCLVHGVISIEDGKMKVKWNEEDVKYPRFSEKKAAERDAIIAELEGKRLSLPQAEMDELNGLRKKYAGYGNIITP
jgi:multimeric flavodoxin WrbA